MARGRWKMYPKVMKLLSCPCIIWKQRTKPILLILVAIFSSSSCTLFNLPNETGVLLFQDDFSSTNSGWNQYRGDSYISEYSEGAYRILVYKKDVEAWALPGLNFSDVIVEVAGTSTDDLENNVFGVLCRYQDSENFYFFLISSDGYSGIGLFYNGKRELLTGDVMLPSDAILKGTATNLIQARCDGNELSLSVNGTMVNQVRSDKLQLGDVGLIAGNYEDGITEILFDDFSVKNP